MVDDLTNESFQTGKAIVSIGTELIQAIVKACRESEQNKALTREDKDTVLSKVVGKVTDNYKETHGSVKRFNREGIDVAHQEVVDERVAKILEQNCRKMHLPVELKATENADGSKSYTAFCEVKNIDQLTALLKMSSQQVLEEEKAMTKTLIVLNDKDQEIFSQSFIHEKDIDYEKLSNVLENGGERFEFKDHEGKLLDKGSTREENAVGKIKEKASTMEPKKKKSLSERIKDKKEISEKKDKNRQREKTKQKSKNMNHSR